MTSLPIALSAALLHFVWQGSVVALLLWAALALARNQSASARYLMCRSALALMSAMPLVTVYLLYRPGRVPLEIFLFRATTVPAVSWLDIALRWALPVWAVGVTVFSLRMMWFYGQAAWMRRRGEQANEWLVAMSREVARRMGVSRTFSVLVSAEGRGPSVIGWLRPVILVPAAAIAGLTPQQLEAVLAHELAHIRRADYLVNLLQSVVETLLFYHPAVWWVSGRIRSERELCCDDLAVSSCGDALAYARALTILEKFRMSVPRLAMASIRGSLVYRIRRIVGAEISSAATSKAPGLVALTVVLVLAVLSLNRAKAQAPAPMPATPPPAAVQPPQSTKADAPKAAAKQVTPDPPEARPAEIHKLLAADNQAVIDDLRKQLAELSLTYNQNHPRIRQLQQLIEQEEEKVGEAASRSRLNETRGDLARFEKLTQIAEAERATTTDEAERNRLSNELLILKTQMNYLENELKLMSSFSAEDLSPEVEKITISGLSNEAQQQLLSRLPVHTGSRLSSLKFKDYFAAVNGLDRNLEFSVVILPDGKAELRIMTPRK